VKEAGGGSSFSLFPFTGGFPRLSTVSPGWSYSLFQNKFYPNTEQLPAPRPPAAGPLPGICPFKEVFPAPGNRPD